MPNILYAFPKIRNLPKIFLRSFENVAPSAVCREDSEVDGERPWRLTPSQQDPERTTV